MENIATKDIEAATRIAADLVANYGEVYWPIFSRLEKELKARQSRSARLAKFCSSTNFE